MTIEHRKLWNHSFLHLHHITLLLYLFIWYSTDLYYPKYLPADMSDSKYKRKKLLRISKPSCSKTFWAFGGGHLQAASTWLSTLMIRAIFFGVRICSTAAESKASQTLLVPQSLTMLLYPLGPYGELAGPSSMCTYIGLYCSRPRPAGAQTNWNPDLTTWGAPLYSTQNSLQVPALKRYIFHLFIPAPRCTLQLPSVPVHWTA